jgi:radical SAM superfamily enzyme YgiQ (UPF0313 family)
MSKSVLVSFNGYPQTPSAFVPDNGLASLASCLLKRGHDTRIFDYNIPETIKWLYSDSKEGFGQALKSYARKIADEILSVQDLDFIGFKLWTGDGFKASTQIATEVKKRNPNLKLIAGGPHVDLFREKIFQNTNAFDVVAFGEGEETITGYAENIDGLRKLEDVPNVIYRSNGTIRQNDEKRIQHMDDLPFPVYDKEVYPTINMKLRMLVSEWARGCPYRCNFCTHPSKSGSVVRSKTATRIVDEFAYDKPFTSVFLSGDSDTPGKLLEEVAEELISRRQKIVYTAITHMNHVNKERLMKMKEAGFTGIFYGMESGSQELLDKSIDKKLKVATIRKAISDAKDTGLTVFTSVIIPAPGETEASKLATLDMLLELKPDYVPVNVPMIGPFSKWHDEPESYGIELSSDYDDRLMFFTPTLLFPPSEWNPLRYKIDGKEFSQIAQESNNFVEQLEKARIATQISCDIFLMAKYAEIEPREFRNKARKILASGDYKEMEQIIQKINRNIT